MVDFRRFLQLISPENQLCEINSMIKEFNKSNSKGENIKKKIRILNELRTFKKGTIINHYSQLL